jgi:hypothetical protein
MQLKIIEDVRSVSLERHQRDIHDDLEVPAGLAGLVRLTW